MESDWLVELAVAPTAFAFESVRTALIHAGRTLNLGLRADEVCRQLVLRARSEDQLCGALLYLQAAVPDGYSVGAVQVAYRRTPACAAEATYAHKKQFGANGEFAEVKLRLEPGRRGSGFQFYNEEMQGNIPGKWVSSVEKGIKAAAEGSETLDVPLTDCEVHLIDGKYHDLDSSGQAFELAGAGAIHAAAAEAGIYLLEPVAKIAVLAPECRIPDIVAELERRAATIDRIAPGDTALIAATGRMVELLGFESGLAEITQGRASAAIVLHEYVRVPEQDGPDDSYPIAAALRA